MRELVLGLGEPEISILRPQTGSHESSVSMTTTNEIKTVLHITVQYAIPVSFGRKATKTNYNCFVAKTGNGMASR
jgi:hypothetical protein